MSNQEKKTSELAFENDYQERESCIFICKICMKSTEFCLLCSDVQYWVLYIEGYIIIDTDRFSKLLQIN